MPSSADVRPLAPPREDALERLLLPLDRARAAVLSLLGGWLGPWMRERDRRVALLGVLAIATALLLAVGAPLWLLALGPIAFGVPHVLADLRYLWVQPGFHRERAVWLLVVPGLLMGTITADVAWGLGAACLALFAVKSTPRRRVLGLSILLPATALAVLYPRPTGLAFAHLHNLVAVALWWALRPRALKAHGPVLLAYAAGSAVIMSGLVDGFLSAGFGRGLGHGLFAHAAILAPFASPRWAARWVALFAFAQSVHYAMWLRLIPEDARPRRAPRPFRASYRALREDLGAIALALLALATLVFAVWAAFDLIAARDGYLRAAIGHGHLELAAGALLFARGGESVTARRSGRPRARGAAPRRGPRS